MHADSHLTFSAQMLSEAIMKVHSAEKKSSSGIITSNDSEQKRRSEYERRVSKHTFFLLPSSLLLSKYFQLEFDCKALRMTSKRVVKRRISHQMKVS